MSLTINDIQKLILAGENQQTEFKSRVDMSRISILVAAFANTDGGTIIYGYAEDKKSFVGISNREIEQIEDFIKVDSIGYLCEGSPIEIEGKIIYVITVKKSKEIIFSKGIPYIRCGEQIIMPSSKDIIKIIHEHDDSEKTEKDYLEDMAEGLNRLFEQNEELKELLEAEKMARDEDRRKAKSEKWKSLFGGLVMGIITGVGANYEFAFLQEEIIYHMRRVVDDMISIVWIQNQIENQQYIVKIEIDSIGRYLSKKNSDFKCFDECIEFLKIINDISNSYKHSVYQTVQILISQKEPSFYVYGYKSNDTSNAEGECLYSQTELLEGFEKMLDIYLSEVYETVL